MPTQLTAIFNKLMMNDTSFAPNLARIKKNQGDEAAQKFIESSIGKETDKIFAEKEFIYTQKQAELYNEKGGAPHLDMEYTVFGQLLYGFDVLEKLSIVYTNQQTSRPVIDLKMQISIIKR
jgi:cyclophilin family peptidyl-prolyl cis-trans isomerase